MQILISRDGQQMGPFEAEDLLGRVKLGEIGLADWAWYEGLTEWKPLQVVLSELGLSIPAAPSPSASGVMRADDSDKKGTMQISLPKGISKISAKFGAKS